MVPLGEGAWKEAETGKISETMRGENEAEFRSTLFFRLISVSTRRFIPRGKRDLPTIPLSQR